MNCAGIRVRPLCAAAVLVVTCAAASAEMITYKAVLDGPSESPPNASPGTGTAWVTFDTIAHLMHVRATFQNLIGTTTVAHIHAPTAMPLNGTVGVATYPGTFPGFPAGVTSGFYEATIDMSQATSYTMAFFNDNGGTPALAEIALHDYFAQGRAYFNIHSSFATGGEIRGFLRPIPLPTPALMGLAGFGVLAAIRRRR